MKVPEGETQPLFFIDRNGIQLGKASEARVQEILSSLPFVESALFTEKNFKNVDIVVVFAAGPDTPAIAPVNVQVKSGSFSMYEFRRKINRQVHHDNQSTLSSTDEWMRANRVVLLNGGYRTTKAKERIAISDEEIIASFSKQVAALEEVEP